MRSGTELSQFLKDFLPTFEIICILSYIGYLPQVLETHREGRVLSYNIYTGEAKTVLNELYLANGIALSLDETFLAISEMSVARIRR